jgi:Pyruvate/2-oxoacid:ferredoxin oxidoreductase gamma subunit
VAAFLRYSSSPLMPRCRIYEPFCVTVFDAEILPPEIALNGLKKEGKLLLNTSGDLSPPWLKAAGGKKIYAVDADHIAADCGLIFSGMPLVSSVMLGALVRILQLASPGLLESILRDSLTQYKNENIEGALQGYKGVGEVLQNAVLQ